MTTIGDVISRLRILIKAQHQDAFVTDRFLYSLYKKYAAFIMRRQDSLNRIMKFNGVYQTLDYFELIDIDKIESQCHCISSGCTFKRTKDKLPVMLEGYWGPLVRSITSIDGSQEIIPTFPITFERIFNQKSAKYNNKKYYWFLNGYLYFPNIDWDAVRIEGVFDEDISSYNCDPTDNCLYMHDREIHIPEFMFAEIEQNVLKDLSLLFKVPEDAAQDNKNIVR